MLGLTHEPSSVVACCVSGVKTTTRNTLAVPVVGYARHPLNGRRFQAQLGALEAAGCSVIERDSISGNAIFRPGLDAAIKRLEPGGCLVVTGLDSLAWREDVLREILQRIGDKSAHLVSLSEGFDSRSPASFFDCAAVFSLFSSRVRGARIEERTPERVDRRRKISDTAWTETERRIIAGELSVAAAAKALKVARSTIQRRLPAISPELA